jgi:tetratricopeptide (TPR) repeat protein
MKKVFIFLGFSSLSIYAFSQNNKKDDTKILLKELAENGCKCVDSISSSNKTKEALSKEISKCINDQTSAYQLGVKLMSVKELEKDAKEVNGKKQINININVNEDSKEYKQYYYELERYMLNNCSSLKLKMAANGEENEKYTSTNEQAIEYYNQAIEESKKENFKSAVNLYEKCLKVDSTFVNAWDNLGICYRRLKEYDKSIFAYNKSLSINPKGLMPLQNLGIVYRLKQDFPNAIKAYEKLALVDKNNPEVYFGIGQVYAMNIKDYEKGLDNICKAYNLYIAQKSPYRTDAETMISQIYSDMKKLGKEDKFNEILKQNNISAK